MEEAEGHPGRSSLYDLDADDLALVMAAREAMRDAYAPYSGFAVGAAVRTVRGHVHVGANMENAAYGVGLCAELSALAAANAAGELDIEAIAIVGLKFMPPVDASMIVTPCGRCRQLISEAAQLAGKDVRVLSCSGDLAQMRTSRISELLPFAFGPANLGLADGWRKMQATLSGYLDRSMPIGIPTLEAVTASPLAAAPNVRARRRG